MSQKHAKIVEGSAIVVFTGPVFKGGNKIQGILIEVVSRNLETDFKKHYKYTKTLYKYTKTLY